jgi:hypothetical protein
MPTFPSNPLDNLAIEPGAIDETIELGGLDTAAALAKVQELIAGAPPGRCYRLSFPPAAGDGRETLFLPLGRYLLEARRAARLSSCLPAPDGSGYVIRVSDS